MFQQTSNYASIVLGSLGAMTDLRHLATEDW